MQAHIHFMIVRIIKRLTHGKSPQPVSTSYQCSRRGGGREKKQTSRQRIFALFRFEYCNVRLWQLLDSSPEVMAEQGYTMVPSEFAHS